MFPGDHALKLENFIHMLILSSYKEGDYFGWLRKVALFIRLRPSIRYQMWGGATIVLKNIIPWHMFGLTKKLNIVHIYEVTYQMWIFSQFATKFSSVYKVSGDSIEVGGCLTLNLSGLSQRFLLLTQITNKDITLMYSVTLSNLLYVTTSYSIDWILQLDNIWPYIPYRFLHYQQVSITR